MQRIYIYVIIAAIVFAASYSSTIKNFFTRGETESEAVQPVPSAREEACERSEIANEVGLLPNRVAIEGHTDARPYSSVAGYTNYELSADRANAARRVLMTNGLHPQQVSEVRGYADTRLHDRDRPFDKANRRISILIKFDKTQTHEQSTEDPSRR